MKALKSSDEERQMVLGACQGNAEAADFVWLAWSYFHAVDDVVDEPTGAEEKVNAFILGQHVTTHPFFVRHGPALNAVIRNCASNYADSAAWERSEDPDKRAWAEAHRHCGLDLLFAVADIVGGWAHRRATARVWRAYNLAVAQEEKQ